MISPYGLAEAHRIAQVNAAAPVQRILAEVFKRTIDPYRLDETFPVYLAAASKVIGAGREVSDRLAREYYRQTAAQAGARAVAADIPAAALSADALETSLRVTGPVHIKSAIGRGVPRHAAYAAGLAASVAAGKRHMLDGGRQYLIGAAHADGAVDGYARVSDGKPCAFCAMLVSRGPVYSEKTVTFRSHDRCGCGVMLVRKGQDGWSSQAQAMRRLWEDNGDFASFSQALREARTLDPAKLTYSQRIVSNMERGAVPTISTPAKPKADTLFSQYVKGKGIDPDAAIKGANPLFRTDRSYQVNCTHTVATYELRRRGYDVSATRLAQGNGRKTDDYLGRWRVSGTDEPPKLQYVRNSVGLRNLVKETGDGSRYGVTVVWKGGRGGHTFIAENINGKIRIMDPQSGNTAYTPFKDVKDRHVWAYRLDNAEPLDTLKEFITKGDPGK